MVVGRQVEMAAPKGNTNALKHGLYARQFTEAQRQGLKKMSWDDFRHEEFLHRSVGAEIFRLLRALLANEMPDIDQVIKMATLLSKNTITTACSARMYAQLNVQEPITKDALSEALDNVPFDICEQEEKEIQELKRRSPYGYKVKGDERESV
jgi:hypothetical protein